MERELFALSPDVRLRKENFGGLVFNKRTGDTLDVDREGFRLLTLLKENEKLSKEEIQAGFFEFSTKVNPESISRLLGELEKEGFVVSLKGLSPKKREESLNLILEESWPDFQPLRAPETVHWAVTYRCEKECPDCYVRRHQQEFKELSKEEAFKVIDKLAEWGVFQLAIGGGEPLLYDNLPDVVEYAHSRGLVVHITTGIDNIGINSLEELSEGLTSLQLGVKPWNLLHRKTSQKKKLNRFVEMTKEFGLQAEANLILSQTTLENFEEIMSHLARADFDRVVLLRYKPPADISQWEQEKPSAKDLLGLEEKLTKLSSKYDLNLRVDCALGFLQRKLESKKALARGIRGCTAGRRIAVLAPDGSLFPCSQLVSSDLKLGNLLSKSPEVIWKESELLKDYRFFRKKGKFKKSICHFCEAVEHCGGCRVFSSDGKGADPNCPQPEVLFLEQLDKTGRKAELREYFKENSSISVEKYMERYGVGRKCATKELEQIRWLSEASNCFPGARGSTRYYRWIEEAINDVQDTIGYTSGGVPFATREQISDWIEEDDNRSYPEWLRENNQ